MANPNRRLVEDIGGWLQLYDDGSVERPGPPEAQLMMAVVAPYDVPRDGITVHDIPADPPLRLYLPEAAARAGSLLPVLIHFHGGAFCVTNPTWTLYHYFYSRLAAAVPVAGIVSITLPLGPEQRLPASIGAGYAAIGWLQSLAQCKPPAEPAPEPAARLRATADFSRVFLIGDSSGANVLHQVAAGLGSAQPGFWNPVNVAGAVLLSPGFSRSVPSQSELENPVSPFISRDMADRFLALALPPGATKDHPYICPMGEAAPPLAGLALPPLLVNVGDSDMLRDPQMEYCDAMRRAGKDVEVVVSRGMGHVFYLNQFAVKSDPATADRTEELVGAIRSFIERH